MLRCLRLSLLAWIFLGLLSTFSVLSAQQAATRAQAEVAAATTPPQPAALLGNPLTEALTLYRKGSFDEAINKYQDVLHDKPNNPDAYAGLIRTYLKKKDVKQAADSAQQALQVADSTPVRVALGELYFRQGKIHEAEAEWVKVINSGRQEPRAYLGLARVRWSIAMYKSGWTMIDKAHSLDPSDPEIQRPCTQKHSRAERIKFLEQYLGGHNTHD